MSYLLSSGSLASAALSQLVTFAILARALGPTEFGLFVQVSAVTTVAVQLCGLGASDCLLRRVSRQPASYASLLGHNLLLIGLTGAALVFVGVAALSGWLRLSAGPSVDTVTLALLLFGNVVMVRLILLVETVFLALGRFHDANRAVVGFALARMATAALACLAFRASTLAEWALWQCAGNLLYAALGAAWIRPLGRPRFAILRGELKPGILFSSQFVMRAVRANVDLLVIGLFAPLAMVGSYGVARRIVDSGYLAIDALNRLLYPRLARESHDGLHHALPMARRALVAALGLGAITGLALFLLAPMLPALFGRQYQELSFFVRCLSGTVILVGAWAAAIDLLGASGRQDVRAWILNGANLLGSMLIAVATWLAAPIGTFVALYLIDAAIVTVAWSNLTRGEPHFTLSQVALNDAIMVVAFAPIVGLLLGLSAITVPWETLVLSVVLYIVIPVIVAQLVRSRLLASGGQAALDRLLGRLGPVSLVALLATLVLLFGFQGEQILAQPMVIALLAVPILIQVYLNAGLAYLLNRIVGEPHCVAGPSALIGASNFFELAVAAAISLFGFNSGAALATVVGVLIEVPVMLTVVWIVNRSKGWYERGDSVRKVQAAD